MAPTQGLYPLARRRPARDETASGLRHKFDLRNVAPELLETIERTGGRGEKMQNHVEIVEQDPTAVALTGRASRNRAISL